MSLDVAPDIAPMEAKLVDALPDEAGWWFEPKWDGFRCLAFKDGDQVLLQSKSGKPLGRFFPEVVRALAALPQPRLVLDGELTISLDSHMAFDALQARLHPAASRIAHLSQATPAQYVVFDCLAEPAGTSLVAAPLKARHVALRRLARDWPADCGVRLSPGTTKRETARSWLAGSGGSIDGVVAKRLSDPYTPGVRSLLKVKHHRTADCVVGGFRRQTDSAYVASLLLGLYDAEDRLNHVGFTSMISDAERPALTQRLEDLAGGCGFTGKAPGGPSRWTTSRSADWTPLKPELVVEVSYDQVTGDRLRHGARLLRWRPDKAPGQCRMDQLTPEVSPLEAIAAQGGGRT